MYDYIIIGSGIAGLFTALRAARHGSVLVLTKGALEESNTRYAQGGIAAAMAPTDSPVLHHGDTIAAGGDLCDEAAVRILTEEAPARIRDLLRLGVPFDRQGGALALGLEAAHRERRILHAGGDATGLHIELSLSDALRAAGVTVIESAFATNLVIEEGRARGVDVAVAGGPPRRFLGRHLVLATGGAGQLFAYTTNPAVATADGLALAFRAGAALIDLEFYQFHPTALRVPGVASFLVSEAVRGEGALLRTTRGERFMERYDHRAELAPRDIVARAIASELARSGADHVLLDLRHLDAAVVNTRFPTITRFCKNLGLDPAREPLPVAPAAHYFMGGVWTNTWGETSVPGLYACGEVACTGVHGANRLASNSLLEGLVFGARIVERSLRPDDVWSANPRTLPGFRSDLAIEVSSGQPGSGVRPTREQLQRLMWQKVGLARDEAGLASAERTLVGWQTASGAETSMAEQELDHLVLVGRLMAVAARARRESRGAHFRGDYPATDATWRRRIVLRDAAWEWNEADHALVSEEICR
jgi:L-aspartate oxidase